VAPWRTHDNTQVLARVNVRKTFRDFDADRSGDLDYEEFRNGLQMLGFRVNDAEFSEVMKILDKDGDGTIAYEEFCNQLGNTTMYGIDGVGASDEAAAADAEERRARSLLGRVWARVDADGSGTLDREEVGQVLVQMGFENTGEKVLNRVMKELDQDGSGDVDFDEFSEWFLNQDESLRNNVPPTPHYKGVAEDDSADVDLRPVWKSDDESDGDKLLNATPALDQHSHAASVPATVSSLRATAHKGQLDRVQVAKSLSTGDIDARWKVPRSPEQRDATVYRVPATQVKYTTEMSLGVVEQELRSKQPTVAAAFAMEDQDRTGVVDKKQFRRILYRLNIPTTESHVDRLFAVFDAKGDGVVSYSAVCEELARREPRNNTVYTDIMDGSGGGGGSPSRRQATAAELLPKNDVQPLVDHPEKPKLWYFWNSPCATSTIAEHMQATGPSSAFFITKDGLNPGSALDMYERGTRWVDRYQQSRKTLKAARAKARGERTRSHMNRCKDTYKLGKTRQDEKVARRTATFRIQRQRYEGSVRRTEPMSNPNVSRHLGYDLGSDMHCPRTRKSARGTVLSQGNELYSSMMLTAGH
jgi:Ca2+-binding EF-hand superfamily protein